MSSEKLFNRNFILICTATLFTFFAFYLLMPIIAKYVIEEFQASPTYAGIVVSSYIITALLARPFSGYLVDSYDRRRFYLFIFSIFTFLFIGYIISSSIEAIIITRVLLGASFSLLTTAASTIAIDVVPTARRGEGIGIYGAIPILSMSIGPMVGLYLIDLFSYKGLFIFAGLSCLIGLIFASFIKTKYYAPIKRQKISWDRAFLKDGVSMAFITACVYFLYGTLMTYMPLYLEEQKIDVNPGNFFLYLGIGIISTRLMTGKLLNNGKYNILIQLGSFLLITSGLIFTFHLNRITFPISSILLGLGFGLTSPPIQSMLIDLVPNNRRGTANSTFFMSLDIGSGIGMLVGGSIAAAFGYRMIYIIGTMIVIIGYSTYMLYSRNDYLKRLRLKESQEEFEGN